MATAGKRRTKYWKDDPARVKIRNVRQNGVSKLAYEIAGSKLRFYLLSDVEREYIRETAKTLFELGVDIGTAATGEKGERRGFVYVIEHPAFPGYVKVGRAFNPESRLQGYQTGCPHRGYTLYASVYFEDCHFAEREIHARLEAEHRNGALGEWFKVTPFIARHMINKLRSIL